MSAQQRNLNGQATPPPADEIEDDEFLAAEDAAEEIPDDPDQSMEVDDDLDPEEEISLQNDSIAHFDSHSDSIFCIASHPLNPSLVVTGGGDDVAYVFDTGSQKTTGIGTSGQPERQAQPLLPREWENNPSASNSNSRQTAERASLPSLQKLDGHTDSVNAVAFTNPQGEYVVTAGLDGKLRTWQANSPKPTKWRFVAETSEVPEINWVIACPCSDPAAEGKNVVAMGASDGSVWVYRINAADKESPMTIVQAFYLHTESCTAGTWSPDGQLLATVAEDGSMHVWDVFQSGQAIISFTSDDQRFAVEGGLYSVAINPTGTMVAVGGADGHIRVIGLPIQADNSKKSGGGKGTANKEQAQSSGQILASLQAQSDGVETLSFASPPLNLLASGSVDGSIALFDTAHRFALRRHVKEAHEEFAVVKVEFARENGRQHLLTTCGMDGVVRRWDSRGGTTAAGQGFLKEWRGHRGDGEGGGVLGFVQYQDRIVTAGDDGVSLLFTDS